MKGAGKGAHSGSDAIQISAGAAPDLGQRSGHRDPTKNTVIQTAARIRADPFRAHSPALRPSLCALDVCTCRLWLPARAIRMGRHAHAGILPRAGGDLRGARGGSRGGEIAKRMARDRAHLARRGRGARKFGAGGSALRQGCSAWITPLEGPTASPIAGRVFARPLFTPGTPSLVHARCERRRPPKTWPCPGRDAQNSH